MNGKILLKSSLNLEGSLNKHRFLLTTGQHFNKGLQEDWNTHGSQHFMFEVLDTVKVKDDASFNLSNELSLLEQLWIDELQPFSGNGYNTDFVIREP